MATSIRRQRPFLRSHSLTEGSGIPRSGLRRTVSIRAVNAHLDSSESVPSEHNSLYNGFLASFEDDGEAFTTEAKEGAGHRSGRLPLGIITPNYPRDSYNREPRSEWQAHVLEPISEHPSWSTLKTSASPVSKDSQQPASSSLKTQASSSSVPPKNQFGNKVYSFDDLDIPSFRPKFSFSSLPAECRRCSRLSSSCGSFSDNTYISERSSPADPIQPIYPAHSRCATPPGLPSFGSPEALRYQPPPQAPQPNQTSEGDLDDCFCCPLGLQEFFGFSSPSPTPSPPLPTGAIARANDGTVVRGRFATRQSGHGVGGGPAGGLENHPFHRETLPVATIQEMKRNEAIAQGRRQSLCCGTVAVHSSSLQAPRTSSLRSSSVSRPSSTYPVPRRVHFVDGAVPNEAPTSVPVPSYIRHPPLVPPPPIADQIQSDQPEARACSMNENDVSGPAVSQPTSSMLAPAPQSTIEQRPLEYVPDFGWAIECCGLCRGFSSEPHDWSRMGDGTSDYTERPTWPTLKEVWHRGRKASKPWIPAWGFRPFGVE